MVMIRFLLNADLPPIFSAQESQLPAMLYSKTSLT
jgi:hypothetical protein